MAQIPIISQQLKQQLVDKGYSYSAIDDGKRIPRWAIPRTTQYNMTTLFLIAASTAGFIICKRNKIPHFPFSVAFGLTCFINLFHHVQSDLTTTASRTSTPTFKYELQRFPQLKQAYQTVNQEMDQKIAALEQQKRQLLG